MNWLPLIAEQQLMEAYALSEQTYIKAVVLFKHSTRCSISSMALGRFERSWKLSETDVPTYFLDLIAHRNLSDKIASLFEIGHESPQVLVIKNGKCIYTASHSDISVSAIETVINS
ncbi:bacillithiol system redox-active protein YtxJ [soil metagenome]